MIALTQEKREELIKYYGTLIDWSDDRLSSDLSDFDRGAIESSKLMTEIALASLTAEPFGWEIAGSIFPTLGEALKPGYRGTPEPIYDEPPVPEIKLPEPIPAMGMDSEYDTGHNDGWNECLAEVKRLNGWGE
ncbi:hypothetical protein [Rosenbergiella epipactidis]|uniref:hypothetical protein n=1 Tax=Rosenbergiella epipactidis TaxID=1544694 RepID=UPI001F4D60B0|nr:hypothetical protein [Rosenbergiella epipactidis]